MDGLMVTLVLGCYPIIEGVRRLKNDQPHAYRAELRKPEQGRCTLWTLWTLWKKP